MSNTEVAMTLREIISQVAGLPMEFDGQANLYLDLGVTSMHALQLLSEIEERYQLHVEDDEFVSSQSLARLVSMVEALLAAKQC